MAGGGGLVMTQGNQLIPSRFEDSLSLQFFLWVSYFYVMLFMYLEFTTQGGPFQVHLISALLHINPKRIKESAYAYSTTALSSPEPEEPQPPAHCSATRLWRVQLQGLFHPHFEIEDHAGTTTRLCSSSSATREPGVPGKTPITASTLPFYPPTHPLDRDLVSCSCSC